MTYAAPCIVCKSVVRQDLSSIKTDGAHNACVPALWSGFEKENILMFARETATNGGGIVTGDCGTMQSGSLRTKCTNCIWAVCTSGGSSIAQSITMCQAALWQSVRPPQDPPSPICCLWDCDLQFAKFQAFAKFATGWCCLRFATSRAATKPPGVNNCFPLQPSGLQLQLGANYGSPTPWFSFQWICCRVEFAFWWQLG